MFALLLASGTIFQAAQAGSTAVQDHAAPEATPAALKGEAWQQITTKIEADRHRILEQDGNWRAHTPSQHYSTTFGPEGPELALKDGKRSHTIGFRFQGARVDGQAIETPSPEPVADGNRMSYRRGSLTEWYVNAPGGLEQGFTIDDGPAGETLHIDIGVHSELTTQLETNALLLSEGDRQVFRYAGLRAWDASGRALSSQLALDGRRLSLAVDIEEAHYPITVDPVMFNEAAKLTAEVPANAYGGDSDAAGYSVSVDGNRALIGAPGSDDGGLSTNGEAFIFELDSSGAGWQFVARLAPDDPGYAAQFGSSVSLSGDRALIGSHSDLQGGSRTGSAYVFDFDGKAWSQSARLIAQDGASHDSFGFSVSLSSDRALIGANHDANGNGSNAGSVYVFDFDGSNWSESAKLTPDDGAPQDGFGHSVSLAGNRALVGSPSGTGHDVNSGSAYLFEFDGDAWQQSAKLVSKDDSGDNSFFGSAVSLSGDRALVGDYGHYSAPLGSGAAFVFDFDGAAWHQSAKLTNDGSARDDEFGYAVSLSGDRAVVGAHGHDGSETGTGAAYLFEFDGTSWHRNARLEADDGAEYDSFGFAVGISGDRVLIGAYGDDDSGGDSGSAYVFDFETEGWSQNGKLVAIGGAAHDRFGRSVSLYGTRALIGAYGDDDGAYNSGAAYVFELEGADWTLTAKLAPADGTSGDRFGRAVSLSGDRALIGAYLAAGDGADDGAAYVFDFDGLEWQESAKLLPNDGLNGQFGWSVSLDGDRALIGSATGSARVFELGASGWSQSARLVPDDFEGDDLFGHVVSLSGDRALVGAQEDDDNGSNSGSAHLFEFDGTSWIQSAKLVAADGASEDWFGSSVSLSGNRALVGAYRDNSDQLDTGSAYVFDFDGVTWIQSAKLEPGVADESDLFGRSVSLYGDRALISASLDDANGGNSGAVYVFEFDGSDWSERAKLTPAYGDAGDNFGQAVSLFGEQALIGASGDDDNGTGSGSAYIFKNVILFSDGFEG
ncbi:FG-GAP repeat protein [Wenzhouxiangella sediminis]|uniref:FG-GAP repeat protein n=1 Tax=Wenzhouxiangella sediminis TaxID=1792836 RepID=UPI0015F2722E|nr:FG-GAP repeat protein [Wenzhouxiangella sediminis]